MEEFISELSQMLRRIDMLNNRLNGNRTKAFPDEETFRGLSWIISLFSSEQPVSSDLVLKSTYSACIDFTTNERRSANEIMASENALGRFDTSPINKSGNLISHSRPLDSANFKYASRDMINDFKTPPRSKVAATDCKQELESKAVTLVVDEASKTYHIPDTVNHKCISILYVENRHHPRLLSAR